MRKSSFIYFLIMALLVLSLSGCGSSSHDSFTLDTNNNRGTDPDNGDGDDDTTVTNAQVAVLQSPVFVSGDTYYFYKGSTLNGMDAKYYVNPDAVSGTGNGVTLNLGFAETLDERFVVTNSSGVVVFAYDPEGTGNKTDGSVTRSNGTQLSYNGLTIDSATISNIATVEYDDTDIHEIVLNSDGTGTYDDNDIAYFNYVWHADPNHAGEYYTSGINGAEVDYDGEAIDGEEVYIARDIRYLTSDADFSGTTTKDNETELAAFYSAEASKDIYNAISADYPNAKGPYVFATLPSSGGMNGGGNGNMTPPDGGNGGTPPDLPSGNNGNMTPPNGGQGGTPPNMAGIAATSSYEDTMTHSASEAYANYVLHITNPGTYRISGEWNGQIWVNVGKKSKESAKAVIILNGVTVSCDVAPAFVIRKAYECDVKFNDTEISKDALPSFDAGAEVTANAGAKIILADDTVNNFTGSNVYRILSGSGDVDDIIKSSASKNVVINGSNIDYQKKLYKMDGAFYSFVSMVIGGESLGTGVLNITSTTYEGLDTELHLTVDSGVINVTAPDDGINVNEDYTSVFTLNGGTLSVTSTGADGIDSNGYIVLNKGTLNVSTASESGPEGALDSIFDDYPQLGIEGIYQSDDVVYNYTPYTSSSSQQQQQQETEITPNDTTVETYDSIEDLIGDLSSSAEVETISVNGTTTTIVIDTVTENEVKIVDDGGRTRTVSETGSTFTLDGDVCTFSGIK